MVAIYSILAGLFIFIVFILYSKFFKKENYGIDEDIPMDTPAVDIIDNSEYTHKISILEEIISNKETLIETINIESNEKDIKIDNLLTEISKKETDINNLKDKQVKEINELQKKSNITEKKISDINTKMESLLSDIKEKEITIEKLNTELLKAKNKKLDNDRMVRVIYRYDNQDDSDVLTDEDIDRINNNEVIEKYTSVEDAKYGKKTNDIIKKIYDNIEPNEIGIYILHQTQEEGIFKRIPKRKYDTLMSFVNTNNNKNGRYKTFIITDDKLYVYDLLNEYM